MTAAQKTYNITYIDFNHPENAVNGTKHAEFGTHICRNSEGQRRREDLPRGIGVCRATCVRNPEAVCLRRAGHGTRGVERGGYQDTLQDEGGRGSSAACTGLAGDERHMSCQHNLPSPQAGQDHAMEEPPCKHCLTLVLLTLLPV